MNLKVWVLFRKPVGCDCEEIVGIRISPEEIEELQSGDYHEWDPELPKGESYRVEEWTVPLDVRKKD